MFGAGFVRASPAAGYGGTVAVRTGGGPIWFRKMDRNRDGDVSRREFLGSRRAFQKLDANNDESIDAAEALTAK